MAQIIDGKAISLAIKDELKEKAAKLKAEGTEVTLAVIQVGNNPASTVYVEIKRRAVNISGSDPFLMSCRRKLQKKSSFR